MVDNKPLCASKVAIKVSGKRNCKTIACSDCSSLCRVALTNIVLASYLPTVITSSSNSIICKLCILYIFKYLSIRLTGNSISKLFRIYASTIFTCCRCSPCQQYISTIFCASKIFNNRRNIVASQQLYACSFATSNFVVSVYDISHLTIQVFSLVDKRFISSSYRIIYGMYQLTISPHFNLSKCSICSLAIK